MGLLGTLAAILVWIWVQYLPGYFLSRAMIPNARTVERHALALICGFSVIPLMLFLVGALGDVPLDAPFLWIAATAVNLGGLTVLVPPSLWKSPDIGKSDTQTLFITFLLCSVFLVIGFRAIDAGDALTTIQHCLYVIALHGIQNDPSHSLPLYDHLTGDFMHFLINHDTSNLSGLAELLFEQRIGNVPLLGPPVALYGTAGWFVASVNALVITSLCTYLGARATGVRHWAAIAGAVIFIWGAQVFCAYYLNENMFALALASFLLWTILKPEVPTGWVVIAGIVCGHLVGVRHTSALFLPAVAIGILWSTHSWKRRTLQLITGTIAAAAAAFPWVYINAIMLGEPFTHPKVQIDSGGRVVENAIWGKRFMFKPLNWPFTDQIVRTVWNPFPTFIWLPLMVSKCFGQLATAIGCVGTWLVRKQRRALSLMLLFALPHWIAMSLLEGIDWEQVTYAAPGLAPFGVALAVGLDKIAERRVAISAGVIALLIAGSSVAMRPLDFPVDMRIISSKVWPNAPSTDAGTQSVKERLTRIAPLPELPRFRWDSVPRTWANMAAIIRQAPAEPVEKLPVYDSGRVVVLSAYSKRKVRAYDFEVAPRSLRTADVPVRTAVWLHTMAFKFKAERLRVHVERLSGRYKIDLVPIGKTDVAQDFTFWLNPWYPPIKSIQVTVNGKPTNDLRILKYGGLVEEGEQLLIATNYGADVIDLVEVPFEISSNEPTNCGIWIFLANVEGRYIETLSPGGAFDVKWQGKTKGTITLPRNMLADSLVLFSEPYCSDHIPQYGDRFGITQAPFGKDSPIRIVLDKIW